MSGGKSQGDSGGALLREGENCWWAGPADRFAWLIDGAAYFSALRAALECATHEILIIGWDIDSQLEMIRDEDSPFYPSPLAATLQSLAERKDGLRIHVLSWDFAMVYVLERELLPAFRFGWQDSERLHFQLDGTHATGASHHQKVVIVDGELAFTGGLDLTRARWDTPEHRANDPRRVNPSGEPYGPFHDVQALVSGAPARKLRELVSFRWKNATGEALPDLDDDAAPVDPWPEAVPCDAENVRVALARTWAEPDGSGVTGEVERLFLDMIAAAERWIYIENQYFTSETIADALAARLAEDDGPEVVVVLPQQTSGWLEQATMDVLRNKVLLTLDGADEHDRLRLVSPVSDALGDETIHVHAKVMVTDARWIRIGSANLSRRSLGLDSECDLVVDGGDGPAVALTAELLAEHLGASTEDVAAVLTERGLVAAVDEFDGGDRRLAPLRVAEGVADDVLEPLAQIADLERPIERIWSDVVEEFEPANAGTARADAREAAGAGADGGERSREDAGKPSAADDRADDGRSPPDRDADEGGDDGRASVPGSRVAGWAFLLVVATVIGFWAVWAMRGGSGELDPAALLETLRDKASHPLAPLAAIPAFVAGSLVVAPVTGMIALCAILFDPWVATLAALSGVLVATVVNHAIGKRLGRAAAGRVPAGVFRRIQSLADASDMWSLAGLRLVPVAPFTVVNLLTGAAGVSLREFLAGTLIGMGPGTLLICLGVDRARAALSSEPVFEPWVVAVMGACGAALIALRVWQNRRDA